MIPTIIVCYVLGVVMTFFVTAMLKRHGKIRTVDEVDATFIAIFWWMFGPSWLFMALASRAWKFLVDE